MKNKIKYTFNSRFEALSGKLSFCAGRTKHDAGGMNNTLISTDSNGNTGDHSGIEPRLENFFRLHEYTNRY